MARHLNLRMTTRPDRAPDGREVVFIDEADGHLKSVDDEGQIIDLEAVAEAAGGTLAAVLAEGNDTGGVGIVSVKTGATNADTSLAAASVDGNANSRTDAVASGTGNADAESFAESDGAGNAIAQSVALAIGGGNASVQAQASATGSGTADADRIAQTLNGGADANTSATATGTGSAQAITTAATETGNATATSAATVASGLGTATSGVSATHGVTTAAVTVEAADSVARLIVNDGASAGAAGDFLGSDGAGHAAWQPLFGSTPEVPATPTEQDIVDALVALGLITQAAP